MKPGQDGSTITAREAAQLATLRYFHEVARARSIRRAAERLNVATSAISRQIAKLEAEVGAPLFERRPRGMELTAAGEIYARHARDVLLAVRRTRHEIEELSGLRRGRVRIRTIEGLVGSFLSPTIGAFRERYPQVVFEVTITGAEDVVASVAAGDADLGIAFNAPILAGVRSLARLRDPVCAVLAPAHALAGRESLGLAEALAVPHAIPAAAFGIRNLLDQAVREGRRSLEPSLLTNSIEALRSFARSGEGVAFLHKLAVQRELEEGLLVAVPVRAAALEAGSVDIVVLEGRSIPPAAERFAGFLADRLHARAEAVAPADLGRL